MFSKSDNIFAAYKKHLEEKAVSQAQQKLMGKAYALKKGEISADDASDEVKKLADQMTLKQLKDFAATKHDGLPAKKEEMEEEDPCWDGYKKVPGKDDYEKGSCVKETFIDESMIHVRLDHLDGDPRQKKASDLLSQYEKKKSISFEGHTDKGALFRVNKQSDISRLDKELKKLATWAEIAEENLDELSSKTLSNYISKASDARGHRKLSTRKLDKRYQGVSRAGKKLDQRNEEEDLDEGSVSVSTVHKELQKNGAKKIKVSDKEITFELNGKKHSVSVDKKFVADKDYMKMQSLFEAGYMDSPSTKAEVDAKDYDEVEGDSLDVQRLTYEEALKELKIKKLDKDTIAMLKSLDPDEARMIIQGLPSSLRKKAMKELGLKEKVDGRTTAYKETASRLMKKKGKVIPAPKSDMSKRMARGQRNDPMNKIGTKHYRKEEVELTEMALPRKDFEKLKKGDKVNVEFDSSMKKGHKVSLVVAGRSKSAKYDVEKVTLKDAGDPRNKTKFILYSRQGKDATLGWGNAAVVMQSFVKESVENGEEKKSGKTFKISFESVNRPNEKKILNFLAQHEQQGNIDFVAQEEKGVVFKVVDEDAVRGMHLELRKFKVEAQEVSSVKEDWKAIEKYAKKSGGVDKADMLKVAGMLKKGDKKGAMKFVQTLDTDPRDWLLKAMGEDVSADDEDEFHRKLDDLVHDTFGKSSDEVKEDTAELEEKRAFVFAAAKAKANGEKKFIFNGKEYKVKLKNGPVVEADPVEEEDDG